MIYILLLVIPFITAALFLYMLFRLTQIIPKRFIALNPEKISITVFNIVWALGAVLFLIFSYILIILLIKWLNYSNFFGAPENQTLGSVILFLIIYPLPIIPAFLLSSFAQILVMQLMLKRSISKESS